MSKLNVYVGEDLRAMLDVIKLPVSQICQDALWSEIQKMIDQKCEKCAKKAKWIINVEGFEANFACDTHVAAWLSDVATVRRINPAAPKLAEAGA